MRALTIHEPWATLIAKGIKRIENRSWSTDYRGPIAIHAGKTVHRDLVTEWGLEDEINPGHILCTVQLVDIKPVAEVQSPFAIGPLCWLLADVRPWRGQSSRLGQQRFWTV